MAVKTKLPNLENSLTEINTLIEKMEHDQLSLEDSLQCFERGIHLIKHAQKILKEAEQKVKILLKNQEMPAGTLEDYQGEPE